MRVALALTVGAVLLSVGSAQAIDYAHYPDSRQPSWLSDGRIFFLSNMDAATTGNPQRVPYFMNADGSDLRLAPFDTTAPDRSRSRDGQWIAFVRDGDVFVSASDGSNARNVTHDTATQTAGPRWSPDGEQLSFVTGTQGPSVVMGGLVEVIRRDGSRRRRLLRGSSAAWISNRELAVAVASGARSFDDSDRVPIVAVDVETQRSRKVVGEHYASGGFDVSPDGATIVFAGWVGWTYGDGSTLYAVETASGSSPRRLTPTACTLRPQDASGSLRGRCYGGADGADRIVGTLFGDVIIAGSGADVIRAGDGQNFIQAQWGDDLVRSGDGRDFIWAGDGHDVVRSGAGHDRVRLGAGRDTVATGADNDSIVANDGARDVLDCGTGRDRATVDALDVVHGCERRFVVAPSPSER